MAFGNGTALMLKPERKENNENPSLQSPKKIVLPSVSVCVCPAHARSDESQLLGMLAPFTFQ